MSHVLVLLAQGCEELEAITVIDLLVRAGVDVCRCGLDEKPVTASRGTVILPDTSIDKIAEQSFDMIVLPGGLPGADHLRDHPLVQQLLKAHAVDNRYIGAICAAPKALAKAGLLSNKTATSYPGVLEALNDSSIHISHKATVIDGNIITSRGPGTAIDFALTLIELLVDKDKRDEIDQQLVR